MQSMHAEGTDREGRSERANLRVLAKRLNLFAFFILQLIPFVFLGTCVGRFKTNREEGNKRGRMGGGGGAHARLCAIYLLDLCVCSHRCFPFYP